MRSLLAFLSAAVLFSAACSKAPEAASAGSGAKTSEATSADIKSSGGNHATIETNKGSMDVEFFPADQPKAVENFRLLAERNYYNGLTFHRIIRDFMIQGGDPNGNGTGGKSAWGGEFADEIKPSSALYQAGYKRGILAMANAGPNTNGSQFFIVLRDYQLPPSYVIFGRLTSGLDVLDALGAVPTGPDDKPLTAQTITKITIKP